MWWQIIKILNSTMCLSIHNWLMVVYKKQSKMKEPPCKQALMYVVFWLKLEPVNIHTPLNHIPITSFPGLVSVPDPKPTPAQIAFSIAHGLYWKQYTRRMRSEDKTIPGLKLLAVQMQHLWNSRRTEN